MASPTPISPRWRRMSRMIRQARQIASVATMTRRAGVSSKPSSQHQLLAVHPPALDELGRVASAAGSGSASSSAAAAAGGGPGRPRGCWC